MIYKEYEIRMQQNIYSGIRVPKITEKERFNKVIALTKWCDFCGTVYSTCEYGTELQHDAMRLPCVITYHTCSVATAIKASKVKVH